MNLHWLTPVGYNGVGELLNSNLASVRMRMGIVSENSGNMKIKFSYGDVVPANVETIIIGKIGSDCKSGRENLWMNQIIQSRLLSKMIIMDYTDHHLGNHNSPMYDFYKNTIHLCDKVVVPSGKMFDLLSDNFNENIHIIEDPIEIQIIQPKKINFNNDITLLWFGHGSNISFLINYLNNSELCNLKINLIVLSNSYGLEAISSIHDNIKSRVKIYADQWSLKNMIKAAEIAHACIIPAGVDSLAKMGASSNRLITAFGLGLPVSADNLDSYLPFCDYYHSMRDSPLSDFVDKFDFYCHKIHLAQKEVVPSYAKENILKKWNALLKV